MIRILAVAAFLIASAAHAQTADPAYLQRAIASVENQRNQALTAQAVAEAKLAGVLEDLAKAQARIKELEGSKEKDRP